MIAPLGLQAGQRIEYLPVPPADVSSLAGQHVLLVGINDVTAEMERAAKAAGADLTFGAVLAVVEMTVDVKAIEKIMEGAELDALFISAGEVSTAGTLETDCDSWERLFDVHCKSPYFFVAKALPLLRRSEKPRVVMVAPLPVCSVESFQSPAAPCAVISQIRGLYVLGMAEEFVDSKEEFNAIWDGSGGNPDAAKCLELLACTGHGSGLHYAVDIAALPSAQTTVGPLDYTAGLDFVDLATKSWLEATLRDASLGDMGE
eukprot:3957390-Prymnesium_polylepis.1